MLESPSPAARQIRDVIVTADRRRRRRQAARRLWGAAPWTAAACLAVAAVSRWAGWPVPVPLAVLTGAIIALGCYLFLGSRHRGITDALAAAIDADARLGGELRSASWFADRGSLDDWSAFHLERAAERLRGIDWTALYPPFRAPRAVVATSLLLIATVALTVAFPERAGIPSDAAAQNAPRPDPDELETLSPELQKQLEALLAAAEAGTLPQGGTGSSGTSVEMRELLARLSQLRDPEALKALARALSSEQSPGSPEAMRSEQEMKSLADRARQAADKSPSREFRDALEKLARNISEATTDDEVASDETRAARSNDFQRGDASELTAEGRLDEATIQSVREAQSAAGGAGIVMMSNEGAPSGPSSPGFGVGGGTGSMNAAGSKTDIERALRQETIEASTDNAGANVDAPVRRKTEQGQAAVTFTKSAAARSDRGRAAAPPAVPESRRSGVQRYFIRKQ